MFLNDWTLTFPADPGVSKHLRHAARRAPDISRLFAPWARSRSNFNQTGECSGAFGGPKSLKRPSLLIYLLPCKEWPTSAFLEFKGNWIPPPASKLPFAPISTQICFFMTQAEVSPENSQFSVDVRALHPPSLPLLLRCFEPLSPSRDSAPPVPMQPRSFPAVPSRAHPCHHFPLIKRLCLCERRLIWGRAGGCWLSHLRLCDIPITPLRREVRQSDLSATFSSKNLSVVKRIKASRRYEDLLEDVHVWHRLELWVSGTCIWCPRWSHRTFLYRCNI